MNVKLAAQLLTETTAKSLKYFGQQGLLKSKDWETTSRFISLCESWFDHFNSRRPTDAKLSRYAFGLRPTDQNKVLDEMLKTVTSMRVNGKNSLYPFQK